VIVPGVKVSLEGLMQSAAKLRPVELTAPPGLVERLVEELGFPCRIIATGGLSSLIGKHAKRIEELDLNLTLEGLRILYERNHKAYGK
jgi:type III pantothenate kinase